MPALLAGRLTVTASDTVDVLPRECALNRRRYAVTYRVERHL
jgi:hypothetical protein